MTRNAAILLVLLLVGVLAPLGYVTYYRAIQSPEQRSDFVVLYAAGRAALDGGDVYGVKHPRGWPYFYPPGGTLLLAGVAWNLGTWYFGLPVSSSHTLIGSILGVGIANSLWNNTGLDGVNWNE